MTFPGIAGIGITNGRFPIIIGDSLLESKKKSANHSFLFKYPSAVQTLTAAAPGQNSSWSLIHPSKSPTNPPTIYTASLAPAKELEVILVYDETRGAFVMERVVKVGLYAKRDAMPSSSSNGGGGGNGKVGKRSVKKGLGSAAAVLVLPTTNCPAANGATTSKVQAASKEEEDEDDEFGLDSIINDIVKKPKSLFGNDDDESDY